MDAGLVGGLIGIGLMACGVLTLACCAKKEEVLRRWRNYRESRVPLLPVVVVNPVRRNLRHWRMKQLLRSK